jgi:hypothetical protein
LEEHAASIFRKDKARCSSKMLVLTYQTAGWCNLDHNKKLLRINFIGAGQRKKIIKYTLLKLEENLSYTLCQDVYELFVRNILTAWSRLTFYFSDSHVLYTIKVINSCLLLQFLSWYWNLAYIKHFPLFVITEWNRDHDNLSFE